MRCGAIKRHFRANPNAHNHKAKLVVQTIGKHAAQIVFDLCKKDREQRHDRANVNQDLGAGKAPRQRINGKLCSKGG